MADEYYLAISYQVTPVSHTCHIQSRMLKRFPKTGLETVDTSSYSLLPNYIVNVLTVRYRHESFSGCLCSLCKITREKETLMYLAHTAFYNCEQIECRIRKLEIV